MEFDWDEGNIRHLARRQVTRREFEEAMRGDVLVLDYQDVDGEDRWRAVGSTKALRILVLSFAAREETIRPITAWDANRKITARYFREMLER